MKVVYLRFQIFGMSKFFVKKEKHILNTTSNIFVLALNGVEWQQFAPNKMVSVDLRNKSVLSSHLLLLVYP